MLVVSGRENDRNSLEEPMKLAPKAQILNPPAADVLHFTLPALSAGVLTVVARP